MEGGAVISGVGGSARVDGSNAVEMSDKGVGVCVNGDGDLEVVGGVGVGLAKDSEKSVRSERSMWRQLMAVVLSSNYWPMVSK